MRKIDERALAGAPLPIERGEHRRAAVGDGNHVDVGAVERVRRAVGRADELRKSAQRRKLRSEAGMRGARAALPQVARAQHDQPRIVGLKVRIAEPEPRHDAGSHVLDDDVGPLHQTVDERDRRRLLDVERHALFRVVEKREASGAIHADLVILVRRILQAEPVGPRQRLHVNDARPEIREVLADGRTGSVSAEFDQRHSFESIAAHRRGPTSIRPSHRFFTSR